MTNSMYSVSVTLLLSLLLLVIVAFKVVKTINSGLTALKAGKSLLHEIDGTNPHWLFGDLLSVCKFHCIYYVTASGSYGSLLCVFSFVRTDV